MNDKLSRKEEAVAEYASRMLDEEALELFRELRKEAISSLERRSRWPRLYRVMDYVIHVITVVRETLIKARLIAP